MDTQTLHDPSKLPLRVTLITGHQWTGGDWLWQAIYFCHIVPHPLTGERRAQGDEKGEPVRNNFLVCSLFIRYFPDIENSLTF